MSHGQFLLVGQSLHDVSWIEGRWSRKEMFSRARIIFNVLLEWRADWTHFCWRAPCTRLGRGICPRGSQEESPEEDQWQSPGWRRRPAPPSTSSSWERPPCHHSWWHAVTCRRGRGSPPRHGWHDSDMPWSQHSPGHMNEEIKIHFKCPHLVFKVLVVESLDPNQLFYCSIVKGVLKDIYNAKHSNCRNT